MKKLIYYPAAGLCFMSAWFFGHAVVMQPQAPLPVRLQLAGFSAGFAVAGTACVKVANQKGDKIAKTNN